MYNRNIYTAISVLTFDAFLYYFRKPPVLDAVRGLPAAERICRQYRFTFRDLNRKKVFLLENLLEDFQSR